MSVYEFDDYQIDADRRRLLHRSNGSIAVTSRSFDTLLYLVTHAGALVSKRELLQAVWGDVVVEENNLTQAISNLRQILGERPDEHRFIVTVPGRGYRFIAPITHRDAAVSALSSPDALQGPSSSPVAASEPRRTHRKYLWSLGAALLLALMLGLWWQLRPATTRPDSNVKTLAVLPFKPLVSDASDPALELGMADNLITRLSLVRNLVVRPLGSVRKYLHTDQDPIAAGRELGVDAVLDGHVHREGNLLRVTTRLVRVGDGSALWVDQFDRPWTNLFDVQDGIAEHVAGALSLTLTSAQQRQLARRYTDKEAAYRYYLLGRYHWLKLVPADIDKSIEYFHRAIAEDPSYALAHAGLAEAYRALAITADRRSADVLPLGKDAALRAIELDEQLDSAWASLCFIQIWWDWDWTAADSSCRRALDLNPNSADGHRNYAILLSDLARHDEAVRHARRASELDPLSLITTAIEGHVLVYAGRNEDALRRLQATLGLEPQFWIAHLFTGKAQLAMGHTQAALAEFESAQRGSGGNSETISLLGYARAKLGDRPGALQSLAELISRRTKQYVPPLNVAMVYQGLGDSEKAVDWLEKAYAERDVRLTFLGVEPKWNSLRANPRFRALAAQLKLGS